MIETKCPTCGSPEIKKSGWRILSNYRKAQTYQCNKCGRTFRDEKEISCEPPAKDKASPDITEFV
jgi:transposase-like protein